jgi:hypothetical protein
MVAASRFRLFAMNDVATPVADEFHCLLVALAGGDGHVDAAVGVHAHER